MQRDAPVVPHFSSWAWWIREPCESGFLEASPFCATFPPQFKSIVHAKTKTCTMSDDDDEENAAAIEVELLLGMYSDNECEIIQDDVTTTF